MDTVESHGEMSKPNIWREAMTAWEPFLFWCVGVLWAFFVLHLWVYHE